MAKVIYSGSGSRYDRCKSDFRDPPHRTIAMPQLPLFPEGITLINSNNGFLRKGSTVTYAYGNLPVSLMHTLWI